MQRLTPQHPTISNASQRLIISLISLACLATSAHAAECSRGFDEAFATPGLDSAVTAMIVFDDGDGPQLYLGGSFSVFNGKGTPCVMRWDGTRLEPLGGLRALSARASWDIHASYGGVQDFAVFDDGAGPALYACGALYIDGCYNERIYVARWTGDEWTPVLSQPTDYLYGDYSGATCLVVHNDGSGPALFVAGAFNSVNGQPFNNIAKWDGQAWSTVGGGLPDDDAECESYPAGVAAMASYDAGDGPALYVSGNYTPFSKDDEYELCLAKWNGTEWSARYLPEKSPDNHWGSPYIVYDMTVFDFGRGPELVLAGAFGDWMDFRTPVVTWNGEQVALLEIGEWGVARSIESCLSSTSPELLIGGYFSRSFAPEDHDESRAARWTADGWELIAPSSRNKESTSFCAYEVGGETSLFFGGEFFRCGEEAAYGVARYDGATFHPIGDAEGYGICGVARFRVLDLGDGPSLYAIGSFPGAGVVAADGLARWVGDGWVGESIDPCLMWRSNRDYATYDAAVYDDGDGPTLYALLEDDDDYHPYHPRLWRKGADGWRIVPGPLLGRPTHGMSLAVMPDGLYILGNELHRYSNGDWVELPAQTTDGYSLMDLYALPDSSGPRLYARAEVGYNAYYDKEHIVVSWTGEEWAQVGDLVGTVNDISICDAGDGPALYASGNLPFGCPCYECDGYAAARWTGEQWEPVGQRCAAPGGALNVWDDGSGPALWAGALRWNGQRFEAQLETYASTYVAFDDGSGPALFLIGSFYTNDTRVGGVVRWRPAPNVLGDLNCDGVVDPFDINMFVLALCRPDDYDRWHSCCNRMLADVNQDGRINAFDIGPFVELLAN